MDDRTLLELAAKAYADPAVRFEHQGAFRVIGRNEEMGCDVMCAWNPLTDDGDALRLAVKLQMELNIGADGMAKAYADGAIQGHGEDFGDPCAATRRAIVRAAAQIALDRSPVSAPGAVEGGNT
jgi:hypothetical protein